MYNTFYFFVTETMTLHLVPLLHFWEKEELLELNTYIKRVSNVNQFWTEGSRPSPQMAVFPQTA